MNPNKLRADKQKLLDQVKAIQAELDSPDCDLTADQKQAREAKADGLLAKATELETQAREVEAREAKARERSELVASLEQAREPQAASKIEVGDPGWKKDPKKGFARHSDFFRAVMTKGSSDERLRYLSVAGTDEQQAGSNPYGGFLIPEGLVSGLLSVAAEDDPFAGRTTSIPMDSPTVRVNARVDKNHTSSVSGGLTVTRKAETASATASRMELEQIVLQANSLFGLSYATEELINDSPSSVVALLEAGFRDEFRSKHIQELLRGTGVGEPEGIQNNPALVTVEVPTSQAADTITGDNIVSMRSRCWRFSEAIWIANHDTYPQLAKAHLNGTDSDVFIYQPARGIDVPDTLLGRPVFYSEYAETLGDKNDLMLVVPSQILEGTLQPLQSAESMHVRFERHERAFKIFTRNDARAWWRAALTPNKSSQTLSPFVTLAARA